MGQHRLCSEPLGCFHGAFFGSRSQRLMAKQGYPTSGSRYGAHPGVAGYPATGSRYGGHPDSAPPTIDFSANIGVQVAASLDTPISFSSTLTLNIVASVGLLAASLDVD